MVTFSPTNSTAAMATLTAQPDQGLGALALPLKGLGIGAGVSVNPPSASFGSVTVGLASDAKTFTIMNTGSIAAKIDSVGPAVNTDMSPNPNFVVDTSKTSLMLAKGASTTFNVSFDPTSEGSETATVPIVVGGKTLAMVGVSGTGTAPMAMGNCGCALGAKRPRPPLGALAIAALALLGMLGARRRTRARR
jgi:hypothetical protein